MKKFVTILLLAVTALTLSLSLSSCEKSNGNRVVITLTDGRKMTAELYPDVAPETVANFLKLVDKKSYEGVLFHRVF